MSTRPQAIGTKLEETERVIITEWRFPPGAETRLHRHTLPYVVVYLTDAQHVVEAGGDRKQVSVKAGASYSRPAGIEHNVINSGEHEVVLIETELK